LAENNKLAAFYTPAEFLLFAPVLPLPQEEPQPLVNVNLPQIKATHFSPVVQKAVVSPQVLRSQPISQY
jgi:hypothetical protein